MQNPAQYHLHIDGVHQSAPPRRCIQAIAVTAPSRKDTMSFPMVSTGLPIHLFETRRKWNLSFLSFTLVSIRFVFSTSGCKFTCLISSKLRMWTMRLAAFSKILVLVNLNACNECVWISASLLTRLHLGIRDLRYRFGL